MDVDEHETERAMENFKNGKLNLQFFAEETAETESTQDKAEETQEKDDKTETKTFTQEEVDDIVKKRIARELKKQQKDNEKSEEKPADKPVDNEKITALEMKVLCYDHDVAKEFEKEAIALAKAYVDDQTDIDKALEKVIEKFPQFKKGADKETNKSWGVKQQTPPKKVDGVTEAFLKRNPDLKL